MAAQGFGRAGLTSPRGGSGLSRLNGKLAVVSGAGQGIGRAIALAFAREGAALCLSDVNSETGADCAEEARRAGASVHFVSADIGVRDDCDRIIAEATRELGGITTLVNVAAWAKVGVAIGDTDDALHERTMDVCYTSVFWMMRAAYPQLKASGNASVINFASNAGTEGMPYNAPYAAAKEAIRGLSRSAAKEWGRDGIRVNIIRPIAASPSTRGWMEDIPEVAKQQSKAIPLGRFGDCDEDIAPAAVFLASDEARFLTAVTLPVDGGGGMER